MDPDSKPIDALEREDYFDLFMRWIISKDWTADSGLESFYAFHAEKLTRYMRECLDGGRNAGGLKRSGEREIDRAFLAWWLYAHANGGPHTSPPWTRTLSELWAVLVHLDMVGQKVDFDQIWEIKSEVLEELREMKDIRDVRAAYEAKRKKPGAVH